MAEEPLQSIATCHAANVAAHEGRSSFTLSTVCTHHLLDARCHMPYITCNMHQLTLVLWLQAGEALGA